MCFSVTQRYLQQVKQSIKHKETNKIKEIKDIEGEKMWEKRLIAKKKGEKESEKCKGACSVNCRVKIGLLLLTLGRSASEWHSTSATDPQRSYMSCTGFR